ncbi:SH3 domain-containing protein [Neomicrococcus lactis]|uniref:Uncharacterized protein YgiM (DUF1202 family) n=1 Tax=Neomicrococcus lactis TaxID=732241 RepID=A0A7W9DC57_9MICC|nr:SH3 domain-containing protein [Neomicrococcus lactis]MBB5599164.1 uncharacterized protein YgiM (DUF1202 family) [Neomicrococcus lactis]
MAVYARAFVVPTTTALATVMLVSGQAAQAAAAVPLIQPGAQPAGTPTALNGAKAGMVSMATTSTRVVSPLASGTYRYSSEYGPRCIPVVGGSTWHLGQDLPADSGSPIFAVADGVVTKTKSGTSSSSGYIVVKHEIDGQVFYTVYVHMWNANTHVAVGQAVRAGQQISVVGSSGPSTAPHLHFEVWKGAWYTGTHIDSAQWLLERGVDLKSNASRVYNTTVPTSCGYSANGGQNLKASASSTSSTLAYLPSGTLMTGIPGEMSNGYVRVSAKGFVGWVPHLGVRPYTGTSGLPPAPTPLDPNFPISPGVGGGSTAPTQPTGSVASGTYQTTANVNMRTGAGTTYAVLATVPSGTNVSVIGSANGWYKVTYNGKTGWMIDDYLKAVTAAPAPTPQPVPGVDTPALGTYKAKTDVNIRSGAGMTYGVVKVLPVGAQVTVSASSNGWLKVSYGTTAGWVAATYLAVVSAPAPAPAPTPVTSTPTHVTTVNLNLRTGPSTTKTVITVLPSGTKVSALSTSGSYTQVQVNGKTGWVATQYIKSLTSTSTPAPAPAPSSGTTIELQDSVAMRTTVSLNMVSAPRDGASRVRILSAGVTVMVDATSGNYSRATYNGTTGWIPTSQLKEVLARTMTATTAVFFRTGPGNTYAKVGTIPGGGSVVVDGEQGGWMRVTYQGKTGWVYQTFLK